ncbi:hypothetical protein CANARDRAFT_206889 [[Candida] arabinofermentans NRRL YB-2248]|uniref:N-alpha-acetyltransferase 30 n=1 Tax=[Candida] arabinofermentans NRRL YB-2248 TaxID=983967 RepID=A0A1E4T428_9ASCO|nr:hypothetical protein CANARDRAFT_206889 [[Candida] arabinofermentans NRRL YB-2248]
MSNIDINDIVYTPLSLDTSKHSKESINSTILELKSLIDKHLSEPYSIYVYRFFLNNWPELCLIAKYGDEIIGCIISKVETHRNVRIRGYIGMLAVNEQYRGLGIAKKLIDLNLNSMINTYKCDEIILETEVVNKTALKLYENFGFIRIKRLFRYYLNKHDAYRLILPINEKSTIRSTFSVILNKEELIESKY